MFDGIILLILGIIFAGFIYYLKRRGDYYQDKFYTEVDRNTVILDEIEGAKKKAVQKALNTQRVVVKGHMAETLFPILSEKLGGYKASDMIFLGNPIDYIIFAGYSQALDSRGYIDEIIFCDIKSGNAQLTDVQQQIKEGIKSGRLILKWLTVRILDNGEIRTE